MRYRVPYPVLFLRRYTHLYDKCKHDLLRNWSSILRMFVFVFLISKTTHTCRRPTCLRQWPASLLIWDSYSRERRLKTQIVHAHKWPQQLTWRLGIPCPNSCSHWWQRICFLTNSCIQVRASSTFSCVKNVNGLNRKRGNVDYDVTAGARLAVTVTTPVAFRHVTLCHVTLSRTFRRFPPQSQWKPSPVLRFGQPKLAPHRNFYVY